MTEQLPPRPDHEAPLPEVLDEGVATTSAYDLLTKPTAEISDADLKLICADLRKRREAYVESKGKRPDRPDKPKAIKPTDESRKQVTADLIAQLGLQL